MATTAPKPLTDDERAQLEALEQRRQYEIQKQAEAQHQARVDALKPVAEFMQLLNIDALNSKAQQIADTSTIDMDVKRRILNMLSTLQMEHQWLSAVSTPPNPNPNPLAPTMLL